MSTLRTNAILDASGGTTATVNGYAPTLSNMAGRNRIINGDMRIDQRNAGASLNIDPASNGDVYTVDRFKVGIFGSTYAANPIAAQRVSDAPSGFTNSLKVTSAATITPDSNRLGSFITHQLEGFNVADFAWGTASASAVTLSFWVKASKTGTMSVSFENSAVDRSYLTTVSISAVNTWERKTVTLSGDTSGTWLTNASLGTSLKFGLMTNGSWLAGTGGSWSGTRAILSTSQTNFIAASSDNVSITGVQLEAGSIATPFEHRSYGQELALCQRYAINYRSAEANGAYYRYGFGECIASTQINLNIVFPVPMRAIPSLTTTGTAANYAAYSRTSVVALSAVPALGNDGSSPYSATLLGNTAGSLTQGSAGALMSNNNQTSYLLFTAEL